MGYVISSGKATLHELKTVYTLEDLHNLCEIISVDRYNEWRVNEFYRKENEKKSKGKKR